LNDNGQGAGTGTPFDGRVGLKLRQRRAALSMSAEAIATAVGLTLLDYLQIEDGRRRPLADELQRTASVLGMRVADLFGESDAFDASVPPRLTTDQFGAK
jgi:transcriptional regulator with XRE-family HTH domain